MQAVCPLFDLTFDLVIFDCDGVLIDSELISATALSDEAATLGVDIPVDYILREFTGLPYPEVVRLIEQRFAPLPEDFENCYRQRLFAGFADGLSIMPGVAEVLDNLAVPFCVATSSSPQRVDFALRQTGLDEVFGLNVFTASEVERGKPAPDLFLHACHRMNARAEQTLVIEDSRSGVEAGISAGMQVVRFTGGSHIMAKDDAGGAHAVLSDYAGFFKHFPLLNKSTL